MGSINTDSTTINFNGANIKIATSGKGLIFADGTTLSSNTEIGGGGGTANLAQVVNLGNATSNTLLLENTDKAIVSSGNIESNIITTIIRFQEGSELPDGQGITLESAANNGNTVSNVVQFSNGFTVGSNLVVDEIGTNVIDVTGRIGATLFVGDGGLLSNISGGGSQTLQQTTDLGNTTTNVVTFTNGLVASSISGLDTLSFTSINTTTPPLQLTASSLNDGVGALRIDSVEPDIYLNDTNGGFATVTFADNDVQRCAFGRNSGNDFYLTVRDPSTNSGNWRDDTLVADSSTGDISLGYKLGIGTTSPSANLHVVGNVYATGNVESNIVTTAIYFGSATYTPGAFVSTLENVTNRGNTVSNVVQFTSSSTSLVTSGRVGVGTTTPYWPLHVTGYTNQNLNSGYASWVEANGGYTTYGSSQLTWNNGTSIYAQYDILSRTTLVAHSGTINSSDSRIKSNIVDISDTSALDKIRLITPKTYTYKDTIHRGTDTVIGFIAQDVKEVIPEATSTRTDQIPNIFEVANVTSNNILNFTTFDTSTLDSNSNTINLRTIYDQEINATIDEVIDSHTIRVIDDLHGNDVVFVYGQVVDDFLFLKKDYIFTLSTAALQEIDRHQQLDKQRIATLESQVAQLMANNT